MRLLVIEHDHVSPLGPVAERFADRGCDLVRHLVVPEKAWHAPGVETEFPDFTDHDAVVVMGAAWSTYDFELVGSWVRPELEQLRAADAAGVPVLGICFGGQLLATVLGGSVARSEHPEIGWTEVWSDDPDVVPEGPWFQWHLDRWTLPPGARELARNAAASQAFVVRRNLAVQFHPELTGAMLAGWLGNGGDTSAAVMGADIEALVADTAAREEDARRRSHRLVDGFLDRVASAALTS
jgi:GMP synthase-like glutamine amidotransferase